MFCWANENWTRTWDGKNENILLEQRCVEGDEEILINDLASAFRDPRYIKVDGKPVFLVYRIKELPNPIESVKKWRAAAQKLGFPGLHIAAIDFYDIHDPREVGIDALVEFPPHKFNGPQNQPDQMPVFTNSDFAGGTLDYRKVARQGILRETPDFTLYRGIAPSWDNTARRQNTPTTLINAEPKPYAVWLKYLREYTRQAFTGRTDNFIFINAWNEWGEGCHLEPDLKWGLGYLEETARSIFFRATDKSKTTAESLESARLNSISALQLSPAPATLPSDGIPSAAAVETEVKALRSEYAPRSLFIKIGSDLLKHWPMLHRIIKKIYLSSKSRR